jgi:hypothetical protein
VYVNWLAETDVLQPEHPEAVTPYVSVPLAD